MNPGAFAVRNRALVNAAVILTIAVGLFALARTRLAAIPLAFTMAAPPFT